MSLGNNKVLQWVISILFAGLFTYFAYVLIEKQKEKLSFQSFIQASHKNAIIFNDIDRVCNKKLTSNDLEIENTVLSSGFDKIIAEKKSNYNEVLGKRALVSFDQNSFVIAFDKSNLALSDIQTILEQEFGLATARNDKKITIEDKSYFYQFFNNYLVISNGEITVSDEIFSPIRFGNADYVKIEDGKTKRYLQTPKITYSSYTQKDSLKGGPIGYKELFNIVPNDFQSVDFYGSSRFENDQTCFFNSTSFSWCESYLAVLKKDSFELVLSPIGLERDLKLILEEETLNNLEDSAQIQTFNMTTFEVSEIIMKENWADQIPSLNKELRYFTQLSNFNILGNSPEAIRWLLTAWQIGSLCSNSENLMYLINHYLPFKMNQLSMQKVNEGWEVSGKIKIKDEVLLADLKLMDETQAVQGVKNLFEKEIEFIAENIRVVGEKSTVQILAYNSSAIQSFNEKGEVNFKKSLTSKIIKIQEVDFENDGKIELALFTENGVDVINVSGKSLNGFPVILAEKCYGGRILNYDNKFDHRIFVGNGNTVSCFNEQGKRVEGWVFEGMSSPLFGEVRYTQVEGKDYLIFQNTLNQFYAVTRRGEPRNTPSKSLISESFAEGVWGSSINSLYVTGYHKGYIYRYFIASPLRDSSAIDVAVNPNAIGWVKIDDQECLWIAQNEQLYQFDRFGFVTKKILKPAPNVTFAGYLSNSPERYVFADNENKKLYLLNERGELITDNPLNGTNIWAATKTHFYSCQGSKLIAYELK